MNIDTIPLQYILYRSWIVANNIILEGGQGTAMNFERHLVLLEKFPDIQKKRVIEAA